MADRELTTRDLAETTDTSVDEEYAASDPEASADSTRENAGLDDTRREESEPGAAAATTPVGEHEPLLPADQTERFTSRWQEIQASFVDQPQESVEQADALVADLMQRLAASFSNERENLEAQWDRGDDVSTEDLRVALTRYRTFFDRLLSA